MKFIVRNSSFPLSYLSLVKINELVAMTEFFSKLCDGNALSFVTRRPKFFAGQWSSFSHAVQQDCQPLKRHQFSSENLERRQSDGSYIFKDNRLNFTAVIVVGLVWVFVKRKIRVLDPKDGRKMVIVNLFCLLYAFLFFCFFKTPLHRVGWPATTRDL